ncbi:hypothetical protein AYW79_13655, partial [Ferroacidibacillus organovorans]
YVYNSEAHSLDVDPEKLDVYNFIKHRILSGTTCSGVCWELNRQGIQSPKGKLWSESVLYRLILNEVHLGRVVYGKTSGGLHKKRKAAPFKVIPRENWIVVENAHPAIKTPEEHAEIVTLLESRRIQPKHARRGTYLLSGLLHCGKCGYSLQFQPKPNGRTLVKKCQKTDAFGNCCGNRGIELEHVEKAVMESLREHEAELLKTPVETNESDFPTEHLLHTKERELESLRDGVNRLKDLFVMGDVNKAEYKTRLERLKDLIVKKENEYEQLKESLDGCSPLIHAERLQLIDELKASWTTAIDVKERNRLMKLIIERIEYRRNWDDIDIHVKFR